MQNVVLKVLFCILLVVPASLVAQDTVYTYTGRPFTNFFGSPGVDTTDSVAGSFTVSAPLAPNLPLTDITALIKTANFFVTGTHHYTIPSPTAIFPAKVSTDSAGNIVQWGIGIYSTNFQSPFNIQVWNDNTGVIGDYFFYDPNGNNQAHSTLAGTWFSGIAPCANDGGDTDGDGLCDNWEKFGFTVNVNGSPVFVDLPSMGADPNHKDIFVQADYMVDPGLCLPLIGCFFGHTHKPKLDAIAMVTQAFANAPVMNPDGITGIRLHVDCGVDCVMNPVTGELWGARSQAHSLVHIDTLGTTSRPTPGELDYNWQAFQDIKSAKFSPARAPAFHYVVWAHELGGELICHSGISRVPGSDFIVSLGNLLSCGWSDNVGSTLQQAGTFMHELGHNLSLRHGGSDDVNYKPNYLSVMNYLFQTNGLEIIGGAPGDLDYSRFLLPSLNENNLDENAGLNGGADLTNYGTRFFCAGATMDTVVVNADGPIDWNCNGNNNETNISAEINGGVVNGAYQNDNSLDTLSSFNDWPHLVYSYNGGAIGVLGLATSPPMQTIAQQEVTQEMDSHLTKLLGVAVAGSGTLQIPSGASTVLTFIVTNQGTQKDTYTLTAGSTVNWGDLSGVPPSLTLSPGATGQLTIPVNVPAFVTAGTTGSFSIKATSQTSSSVRDTAEVDLTLSAPVGDFTISATPTSQTIPIAKSAAFTLTLAPLAGFVGNVPLTCAGGPFTSTCTISPSSLKLNGSNSATAGVTISFAKNSDTKSTFTFVLKGTFGSFWHSTSVIVTVKQ